MPSKKSNAPAKREPKPDELKLMLEAADRLAARPHRAEMVWNDGQLDAPHSDPNGNMRAIADVLGTSSSQFLSIQLGALDYSARSRGEARGASATGLNSSLALVAAIRPENELEAALAVQMAGVHSLACELLGRTRQSDRTDHMALYGGLAVKMTRTFAAQMEALAKLRGGGKQTVEVKHVYVNGNAVVGDVHHGGPRGGAQPETGEQPHAKALDYAPGAQLPEVWSEDSGWGAVPVAGGAGAQAVPDARRD